MNEGRSNQNTSHSLLHLDMPLISEVSISQQYDRSWLLVGVTAAAAAGAKPGAVGLGNLANTFFCVLR